LNDNTISDAFQLFMKEFPEHSGAWMEMVGKLDTANRLDEKTKALAYLAVLAASGLESGIPFHVQHAKSLGASRDEIVGAIFVGLPAVGHRVIHALPAAVRAYDAATA
jgi:alkylhydroperoxidase/carboxymuconolactone decarboxylase family protein YurZ